MIQTEDGQIELNHLLKERNQAKCREVEIKHELLVIEQNLKILNEKLDKLLKHPNPNPDRGLISTFTPRPEFYWSHDY